METLLIDHPSLRLCLNRQTSGVAVIKFLVRNLSELGEDSPWTIDVVYQWPLPAWEDRLKLDFTGTAFPDPELLPVIDILVNV